MKGRFIIFAVAAILSAACDPAPIEVVDINTPDPKDEPEITVYIAELNSKNKDRYGEWITVNYGEQYIVSASCNRKDLKLSLYSSDEQVATFEEFGENAWIVTARFPGQTDLQVYTIDDGKEYYSSHEFAVFGEITLQAECTPVFCKAGFSVVDNPFGEMLADVHIDMTLVGWPYSDENNKKRISVDPFEARRVSIQSDSDYADVYDFSAASDEMYNSWTGGAINSGEYYCPHGAVLNYVFKLSNRYITVNMLDDEDGERNWQFYTVANVKTEGVVEYE